jgi:hypothetical protein
MSETTNTIDQTAVEAVVTKQTPALVKAVEAVVRAGETLRGARLALGRKAGTMVEALRLIGMEAEAIRETVLPIIHSAGLMVEWEAVAGWIRADANEKGLAEDQRGVFSIDGLLSIGRYPEEGDPEKGLPPRSEWVQGLIDQGVTGDRPVREALKAAKGTRESASAATGSSAIVKALGKVGSKAVEAFKACEGFEALTADQADAVEALIIEALRVTTPKHRTATKAERNAAAELFYVGPPAEDEADQAETA